MELLNKLTWISQPFCPVLDVDGVMCPAGFGCFLKHPEGSLELNISREQSGIMLLHEKQHLRLWRSHSGGGGGSRAAGILFLATSFQMQPSSEHRLAQERC